MVPLAYFWPLAIFLTPLKQAALHDGGSNDREHEGPLKDPEIKGDVDGLAFLFPLQQTTTQDEAGELLSRLEAELPSQPRAWALCETYLSQFSWWFRPIKREELLNDILGPIYKSVGDPTGSGGYHHGDRSPHLLAVLYMIFAVGALVDLALPPCSVEAERYYRLGCAALALKSIFASPDYETIAALGLMAGYHSLCSTRHTTEGAWSLITLASRLSHSVGGNLSADRHQRTTDLRLGGTTGGTPYVASSLSSLRHSSDRLFQRSRQREMGTRSRDG